MEIKPNIRMKWAYSEILIFAVSSMMNVPHLSDLAVNSKGFETLVSSHDHIAIVI